MSQIKRPASKRTAPHFFIFFVLMNLGGLFSVRAQTPKSVNLTPIVVKDNKRIGLPSSSQGAKIYSGKKALEIPAETLPQTPQNNLRQMLTQVPGLMISEVNNESFTSLNFRGLGDPHESFNINILKDGLPLSADPYGYPGTYYSPPREALESIEFVHGGASLLYGPQPGGALNYKLKAAPVKAQKNQITTSQTGGSFGQYSTYNQAQGSNDNIGYLASIHYRRSDGFRAHNSDYQIVNPRINLNYRPDGSAKSVFKLDFDYYQGDHGEPGGLARTASSTVYDINTQRRQSPLRFDRLQIERSQLALGWDYILSEQTLIEAKIWGGQFKRQSFRQRGSGFGVIPTQFSNDIQSQIFHSLGSDVRLIHSYRLFGQEQKFTIGSTVFDIDSPMTVDLGGSPTARGGIRRHELDRSTTSLAAFAEHEFNYENLVVVPGFRVERIRQEIKEKLRFDNTNLRNSTDSTTVLLGGLGLEYKLKLLTLFANLSEGFKPVTYTDAIPLGQNATVSEDILPGRTVSRELGVRRKTDSSFIELSVFDIHYSNQIGLVGFNFQNVGSGEHKGTSLLVDHNLTPKWGGFLSASWLEARFTSPSLNGKTPSYSPGYLYRAGLRYNYAAKSRILLQTQIVDQHYGNDSNSFLQSIPGYTVWDLSGEHNLGQLGLASASVRWGIQNLMDKEYFSRVRTNGIEPAQPRTFYLGAAFDF